jgi:ribonuclease D
VLYIALCRSSSSLFAMASAAAAAPVFRPPQPLLMSACGNSAHVLFTNRLLDAEMWLQTHVLQGNCACIGFDTESEPVYRQPNQLALLQFAVRDAQGAVHVLLLNIHSFGPNTAAWLPYCPSLNAVLSSASLRKFAVDTRNDERELLKLGLPAAGLLDLQCHPKAAALVEAKKRAGSALLATTFLGIHLPKDDQVTRSHWARVPLSRGQLQYATQDVVLALRLAETLYEAAEQQQPQLQQTAFTGFAQQVFHAK